MTQLIDKSALVAEIERRISNHNKELKHASDEDFVSSWASDEENQKLALTALIPFINTLEVKEVDLEKEIELVKGDYEQVDVAWNNDFDFIAKHFFELGLKAKGEIYVVTRSEEHADYVECAFLSESKAKEYCKHYNENENCYARNITKIKIQ